MRSAFGPSSLPLALVALLAACGPTYSPDTYSTAAVQQANKVDQGVVIGVRDVAVSVSGGVGAITGGAAGGIAGAQVGTGAVSALSALGGSLIGGLAGATAEKVTSDTRAFEYIVRKPNGDLISVTQKDQTPLPIGANVLVIAGAQARIVPDYTVREVATVPNPQPSEAKPATPPPGPDPAPVAAAPAEGQKPGSPPTPEGTPAPSVSGAPVEQQI